MKLLYVTCVLPYPPRSGHAVMAANHMRHLARAGHTVDLLAYKSERNPDDTGDLGQWCREIELVPRPRYREMVWNRWTRAIVDPFRDVTDYRSRNMQRAVRRRLADNNYDVVIFHLMPSGQFRPRDYTGATVWALEAPFSLRMQREVAVRYRWYKRPWGRFLANRTKRYERRLARRFDRVLCLSLEEYPTYGDVVGRDKLVELQYGVDIDYFSPAPEVRRREGMIVFSGNMSHPPNVDAVEYFCSNIFPLVVERVPSATVWIVGVDPPASITKWASDPRIQVTGYVPDVRTYLREARVSVCPMRPRVGIVSKLLEALACGTPVVATAAGISGSGAVAGEHLHVADTPADFADKVVALLSGDRWQELSAAGRKFVVENYSWQTSAAGFLRVLEEVAAKHRKPGAARAAAAVKEER